MYKHRNNLYFYCQSSLLSSSDIVLYKVFKVFGIVPNAQTLRWLVCVVHYFYQI